MHFINLPKKKISWVAILLLLVACNNKYKENQINYEINSQFLEIVEAIKEWCKINKIKLFEFE